MLLRAVSPDKGKQGQSGNEKQYRNKLRLRKGNTGNMVEGIDTNGLDGEALQAIQDEVPSKHLSR